MKSFAGSDPGRNDREVVSTLQVSTRPLGIPTMYDRSMQALHTHTLVPLSEMLADPDSYGFRMRRSVDDAIEQTFIVLARRHAAEWILDADIKACFDEIDHEWLFRNIPMDKRMLKSWLKAGYMEEDVFHETEKGTPQGGIISPVLANMTLDGLAAAVKAAVPSKDAKVNMVRFADDFIVTGATRALLEDKVLPVVKTFLTERGLQVSKAKTRIVHIDEGFDFLGRNVRKYGGKLLIKPARKSVKRFLNKIREEIKSSGSRTGEFLIEQLILKLRGWGYTFRHAVAKATFSQVDNAVYWLLRRWMRRLHPKKNKAWLDKRYTRQIGSRTEISVQRKWQPSLRVELFRLSTIAIERHVKVQAKATPFDPAYRRYFQMRGAYKHRRPKRDDCLPHEAGAARHVSLPMLDTVQPGQSGLTGA